MIKLNRLTRPYIIATIVIISVFCSFQFLRFPKRTIHTSRAASDPSLWQQWTLAFKGEASDADIKHAEKAGSEGEGHAWESSWDDQGALNEALKSLPTKTFQGSAFSSLSTSPPQTTQSDDKPEPEWMQRLKHLASVVSEKERQREMERSSSAAAMKPLVVETSTPTETMLTTTVTVTASVTMTEQYASAIRTALPLPALNGTFDVASNSRSSGSDGPLPHQVVLVTAADGKGHNGGIENILERTAENRKAYCKHHGYNYHFVNITNYDLGGVHPVWKKIPAIIDAFNTYPGAEWVFFLDLDAIVMNERQDLNSLVLSHEGMKRSLDFGAEFLDYDGQRMGSFMPRDADLDQLDLLIAQDHHGVNAGSFFLRRSAWAAWLLDIWADPFFMRADLPRLEQDTLLHFIKHHPTFRSHVGLLKQRTLNAYTEGPPDMAWQEGDLVVHFAGCWVDDSCQKRFDTFWAKRQTS